MKYKKGKILFMGFIESFSNAVFGKVEDMAKKAPDSNLISKIHELQQKIDDEDTYSDDKTALEILKNEADKRGLYY